MRPFLVVGCGGSGGVTLRFMMDQLHADLVQHGVTELPKAWQFVHIDVPANPEAGRGMPPAVGTREGKYVPLVQVPTTYGTLVDGMIARLEPSGAASRLSTWVVDPADANPTIIDGAGQLRGVGRLLTLANLTTVRTELREALDRIKAAGVREDLARLSAKIAPGQEAMAGQPPLVLVVSSMAGGAGASMALDVCRVLSGVDPVAGQTTALLLYTPEVFAQLGADNQLGAAANGLAMLGELVATQLQSARHDDDVLFQGLNMEPAAAAAAIPFKRVIPIGARIGSDGALFADGQLEGIYRGVGRGLAALMLSSQVTAQWAQYDLTNYVPAGGSTRDFAWSASAQDAKWGTFGFAQLSLGRDRYAEYAAQRLARVAVHHLVEGHRRPDLSTTPDQQLAAAVNAAWPDFTLGVGFPPDGNAGAWFDAAFDASALAAGQGIVADHVERVLNQPGQSEQWAAYVANTVGQQASAMNADAEARAYRLVHDWYELALERAERTVADVVARDGLPVATRLVDHLRSGMDFLLGHVRQMAQVERTDAATYPAAVAGRLSGYKGSIDSRHEIVGLFRNAYSDSARRAVRGASLRLLVDVLTSYKEELLQPLQNALEEGVRGLDSRLKAQPSPAGRASLKTDEPALWPEPDRDAPARFLQAHNEVLLIDAKEFPQHFTDHVTTSAEPDRPGVSLLDATATAVRQIIADDWQVQGGTRPRQLLVRRSTWRPPVLRRRPQSADGTGLGEPAQTGAGSYAVAVRPGEVLQRARDWVHRSQSTFELFIRESLRTYVGNPDLPDYERDRRMDLLASQFRKTLQLANPLVAVHNNLVERLEDQGASLVRYKFSEVPFRGLPPLEQRLVQDLQNSQTRVSPLSVELLEAVMTSESPTTRIDVFGSYTSLSPMVFRSLLAPISEGWANAANKRTEFAAHRRSRRLRGAVAMNDKQRRAVVAGWYLARFTGRLRFPGEVPGCTAVEVHDPENGGWSRFPQPLIVSDLELARRRNNYLPAVLLSYGLALARASAAGDLSPLRPYTVLRTMWDRHESGIGDNDRLSLLAGWDHVSAFLAAQDEPTGAPPNALLTLGVDPEQLRAQWLQELDRMLASIGTRFLDTEEEPGAVGGGTYARLTKRVDVLGAPLFHEVAADAFHALTLVRHLVQEAPSKGSAPAQDEDDEVLA